MYIQDGHVVFDGGDEKYLIFKDVGDGAVAPAPNLAAVIAAKLNLLDSYEDIAVAVYSAVNKERSPLVAVVAGVKSLALLEKYAPEHRPRVWDMDGTEWWVGFDEADVVKAYLKANRSVVEDGDPSPSLLGDDDLLNLRFNIDNGGAKFISFAERLVQVVVGNTTEEGMGGLISKQSSDKRKQEGFGFLFASTEY